MLTIEDAINNIDIVISNVKMTRQEHASLQQSLSILVNRIKELEEELEENKHD